MKRLILVLAAVFARPLIAVLAVSLSSSTFGAPPSMADAEQARIERLAGPGRIWGTVRYFQPALATRPVDWDKALVEAFPRVDAAESQAEYIAAINGMRAALGDPATRARRVGTDNKARDEEVGGVHYQFEQKVSKASGERYTGKVVMLIDANAQSQAEHTSLFFEAATPMAGNCSGSGCNRTSASNRSSPASPPAATRC